MVTDSMKELGAAHGHLAPRFVVAALSVPARQVQHGAPTGIVASADVPPALLAPLAGPETPPTHRKLGSIRQ